MKKLAIVAAIAALAFADVLPQNFWKCVALTEFTNQNPPIPLKSEYVEVKKYDCQNDIIYLGIESDTPGILKLKKDIETKNFMLKHCKIKNHEAAAYVDKNSQKGVIAVKLNNGKTLVLLFNGTDFLKYVTYLHDLNLDEIENSFS